MANEVVMPRLSDTMDTGTIAKWLKNEGDEVKKGEILAEIETDKANMELESYAAGILTNISVREGQSAAVGEPIAMIAADQSEAETLRAGGGGTQPTATAPAEATPDGARQDQVAPAQSAPAAPQVGKTEPQERVKASPLARRIAQEHGIDLRAVAGTGPGGRITREDVQSFLNQTAPTAQPQQPAEVQQPAAAQQLQQPAAAAPQQPAQPAGLRGAEPVEMTRMQQTIARRMTEARFSAPEFVLTVDVDMTEARALVQMLRGMEGAPRIGPNDLLVKAVATALAQHPEVNAGWENNTITRYSRVNIGVAVAIEGGLVVPVVQDADKKALGQIARESKGLIDRARGNKLAPSDYEGGTFTISNLGMYGIAQFTPVINMPEACIMGVGAIVPTPVVRDGEVVVRDRMRITLSCDHRVVNGAQGAEFLQTLTRILENPMLALL